MPSTLEAFFQAAADGGRRLYLHHSPGSGQPVRGLVLQLHAWAEEMNKSRHMAAQASRALADHGFAVLQVDLLGCGDSSGDFGDARWNLWLDDAVAAASWLQLRHPGKDLWLWGHRFGALIASAAAPRIVGPLNLLVWQPLLQGKSMMQQYLRLKAAAQLADGGGKAILDAARGDLAAGRAIEVAGYTLDPALYHAVQSVSFEPVAAPVPADRRDQASVAPRLVWLELSNHPAPGISPAAHAAASAWTAAGWTVETQAVAGPPFWQTVDIEEAPALVAATVAHLCRTAAPTPATARTAPVAAA
jgi:uncharacterized protein